jgi:predicted amidohydrolase YtcJ
MPCTGRWGSRGSELSESKTVILDAGEARARLLAGELPTWGRACHDARAVRTLYRAAKVHTLSYPTTGDWLLVDGRHVQRVGSGDPPEADRSVELPGATIVPGFVDTHVHLTSTGLAISNADVQAVRSARELLDLVRSRPTVAAAAVILQGYDESTWDDPALPDIQELDDASPLPLIIRRIDGHVALANNAAITQAQLTDDAGALRDAAGFTGRITRSAVERLNRWAWQALSDNEVQELQLKAAALAASTGVTFVHEMSMPHDSGMRDLQVFLAHRGSLPTDSVAIVATMDIPQVIDLGLGAIGGDLPVDGSIGARTASLMAPYADDEGTGAIYYSDDELASFFHDGHAAGLQVGVHAIGDRAIEQVISTWERVYQTLDSRQKRHFRARRHRVEHFEMASSDQIERAAMLGLGVSVQPAFDRRWAGPGGLYEIALGSERASAMNQFRAMIERGVEVGAGSDTPITPFDPIMAVVAMQQHHHPEQRLTRSAAIQVHTIGGARLAHMEEKKGALGPGMHADFAAFETDIFEQDDIEGMRPILTVSLGREVFAQ